MPADRRTKRMPTPESARALARSLGPASPRMLRRLARYCDATPDVPLGDVIAHRLEARATLLEQADAETTRVTRELELTQQQLGMARAALRDAAFCARLTEAEIDRLAAIVANLTDPTPAARPSRVTIVYAYGDVEPGDLGAELGAELAYLLSSPER